MEAIPLKIAEQLVNLSNAPSEKLLADYILQDSYMADVPGRWRVNRTFELQTHLSKDKTMMTFHLVEKLRDQTIERLNIEDVESITLNEKLIITAEGIELRFPIQSENE